MQLSACSWREINSILISIRILVIAVANKSYRNKKRTIFMKAKAFRSEME